MHLPNESRTALELFDDFESDFFKRNGFYGREDFIELANRFGIPEKRAETVLNTFPARKQAIGDLIASSFLSANGKQDYLVRLNDRLRATA